MSITEQLAAQDYAQTDQLDFNTYNTSDLNTELPSRVLKRDGRTAVFEPNRIVQAIQKAFAASEEAEPQWTALRVTYTVLDRLRTRHANKPTVEPTVEEIQDLVEDALMAHRFPKTARAYILYREQRSKVRELNDSLMQTFSSLTFNDELSDSQRENANVDANTAMGTMLKYGSESAKRFNMLSVLKPAHSRAHQVGDIHIHDLDFLTLTMTCCQISLRDLFRGGFSTGHGVLREPRSIASYASLACIAIQSNQNDQHGGQSIPNFDYDMAEGVRLTFLTSYRSNLGKAFELLAPEIDREAAMAAVADARLGGDEDVLPMEVIAIMAATGADEETVTKAQAFAREQAIKETDRATYQAMEAFLHNLNTMNSRAGAQTPFSSINYGTDTSAEGQMLIRNLLLATEAGLGRGETPIFPIQIFRVKEGVNFNPGDPNYDLFKLACRVSAKRLFPNFSFVDAPFNADFYEPGRPETEVAYMGCRTRVLANVADPTQQITHGRGNLSFTSINLPRLAIESAGDQSAFFAGLDTQLELVVDQLLDRLRIQSSKHVYNFPFLMGQGVWLDAKDLDPKDSIAEVLKHGTLTVGFIGLAETLTALIGEHHGQSEKAQRLGLQIVNHMRERLDAKSKQHRLNFSLIATPAEGLSGRFVRIDKERYGVIPGVTDKDYYTNSFHIPVDFEITAFEKINLEAPYHELTNGGHISYIELNGDPGRNLDAFEAIIRHMHAAGIGYGAINHPVDRDPQCGFSGVIDDVCPRCGRKDSAAAPFDRIRRITGYLVGTLDRFNDAKRCEERDRVKHGLPR